MTGVLVALLAILWALVLVPPLMKTRDNTSLTGTVGSFNKGMRALGSNHAQPLTGGRYVLTPKTPLDAPDPRLVIHRRRRMFCGILTGLVLTLALGAIPALRMLWWASLILAVTMGAFAAFLISEKGRNDYLKLQGGSRTSPSARESRTPDVPTALRLYQNETEYLPPISRPQPVFRILDEDDEEDDGLSELGWAQAGQL